MVMLDKFCFALCIECLVCVLVVAILYHVVNHRLLIAQIFVTYTFKNYTLGVKKLNAVFYYIWSRNSDDSISKLINC